MSYSIEEQEAVHFKYPGVHTIHGDKISPPLSADDVAQALREYRSLSKYGNEFAGIADVPPARAVAVGLVSAEFDARVSGLVSGYGAAERDSWPRQVEEARGVVADPAAPAPLLGALVRDGESVGDLAARVLKKADDHAAVLGKFIAARRVHAAALARLETVAEIAAYDMSAGWPEI